MFVNSCLFWLFRLLLLVQDLRNVIFDLSRIYDDIPPCRLIIIDSKINDPANVLVYLYYLFVCLLVLVIFWRGFTIAYSMSWKHGFEWWFSRSWMRFLQTISREFPVFHLVSFVVVVVVVNSISIEDWFVVRIFRTRPTTTIVEFLSSDMPLCFLSIWNGWYVIKFLVYSLLWFC